MAQAPRDHYDVLGVDRGATVDQIKAAFRRLAIQYHPDRNPGDPQAAGRFKELNAAYQVLSDPQRRALYDRLGHRAEEPGSPFASGGPFAGGVVDLSDIAFDGLLGDLLGVFGVGRGDRGDVQADLEVGFEEAAFGCEKQLGYTRVVSCGDCRGTGAAPGSNPDVCSACSGRGRVRYQQGLFPIAVERVCSRCKGTGRIVTKPCATCRGQALMASQATVTLEIPAGIEDGAKKVIDGAGSRPRVDRPPGHLEVTVRVKAHPFFRRVGDDVVCNVPITFAVAALGGEVDVPTLEGRGKVKVPAGTQPGTVLRLRGKGIPVRGGAGRGDQRIEVALEVPTRLTARQRELIEEFAREAGEEVQPQRRSFMEKLRDWLE
jgi:molecular chaperone DnaJ